MNKSVAMSGESSSNSGVNGVTGLDCTNASRGVWLVKVPKYMSNKWQKALPLTEVGRLSITKSSSGRPEILFNLSQEVTKSETNDSSAVKQVMIPTEHQFAISDIKNQTLAVFSQMSEESSTSGLALEGNVVQKGECRPIGNDNYMNLKKETIRKASQPARTVQQLDRAVINYKPISAHKSDVIHNLLLDFELKKKSEGKKSREDKDKVQDMLFSAFEKHQYYNIKDLERVTRQPIPYLKEILKEICHYNAKNPHKNMWELKPEFRHYKQNQS
ncbi:unnamed protein product [Medioppia subpectinata]|uniref:General transcription factor IIF subunit 2 n=1 Tax=Medioppia subpectinata TaxID=1979941 RepID=A0A7R9KVR7_9ACAR|nr:unnamed protein product [Medioppia subpectinata]CAG2109632.1 unnamed protein product [Medioppia subpectinata]